jgi:xanthine/uracil permease
VGTAFERFAVIMSIVVVWLYAFFLTVGGAYKNAAPKTQFHCRTDRSGLVGGAPWISVPYPFQWGAPTFDAGEAFAMMAASFVALVEVYYSDKPMIPIYCLLYPRWYCISSS